MQMFEIHLFIYSIYLTETCATSNVTYTIAWQFIDTCQS